MPFLKYAHLCEYARLDGHGNLSLIAIFENLVFPSVPVIWPVISIAAAWNVEPGEQFSYATRLAAPDGTIISAGQPVMVNVSPNQPGAASIPQISGFLGVTLPVFGEYHAELLVNSVVVHSLPFNVLKSSPA